MALWLVFAFPLTAQPLSCAPHDISISPSGDNTVDRGQQVTLEVTDAHAPTPLKIDWYHVYAGGADLVHSFNCPRPAAQCTESFYKTSITSDIGYFARVSNPCGQAESQTVRFFVKAPSPGAINVTTNLTAATFTIVGPATFSGSGMSFSQTNAPAGTYTITFGQVTGYATPAPQTQTLTAGGSVTFTGSYQASVGTITVTTNLQAASFTIVGPATFTGSGTSFSRSNAPAGTYTISFDPVGGYITPPPQSQILTGRGSITFIGSYQPSGTTTGTITITTNLEVATFTIVGPATYVGKGMSFIQNNAPAGFYTISFGAVPGYLTPPTQTQTLLAGAAIIITVSYKPTPLSLGCPSQSGIVDLSYSSRLAAAGGNAPYTFWLLSGSLPPGLVFDYFGAISGSPTGAGTFTFASGVQDDNGLTAIANCTIVITGAQCSVSPSRDGLRPLQTSDCSCTNPPSGEHFWPQNSTIDVYIDSSQFSDSEIDAIKAAFNNWQIANQNNGSHVSFDFVDTPPELRINTFEVYKGVLKCPPGNPCVAATQLGPDNSSLVAWAITTLDANLTYLALTNVLAHEIGHLLYLDDCATCAPQTSVMNLVQAIINNNVLPSGRPSPSACDNAVVKEHYALTSDIP